MKNVNYDKIQMRFLSSRLTSFNTIEKTSVQVSLVPDTSLNLGENCIKVPGPVFEFFCSIIENGKVASVNAISATLKDDSVIFSGDI